MKFNINAKDIATFLNSQLNGKNLQITNVKPLEKIEENTFSFSKYKELNVNKKCLLLVPIDSMYMNVPFSYICVENPRLSFATVLENFFVKKNSTAGIDSTSIIGNDSQIGENVSIGRNCTIGENVVIGEGTTINNNVVIYNNTVIGKNCYIKSGAIIGEDGFGFDFDKEGIPLRIPHIGNVQIGNNVEVGSHSIIARGTITSTLIHDNVKIDDHTIIAHNIEIGKNTIITGHCAIGGSVRIGEKCWIGSNSSIIQKVKIGNNVTIGIGSLITSNIADSSVYSEIPTMNIEKASKYKNIISKMLKSKLINNKE